MIHPCLIMHASPSMLARRPQDNLAIFGFAESTRNTRRRGTGSVREGCHPQRCVKRNITCIGCASLPASFSCSMCCSCRRPRRPWDRIPCTCCGYSPKSAYFPRAGGSTSTAGGCANHMALSKKCTIFNVSASNCLRAPGLCFISGWV